MWGGVLPHCKYTIGVFYNNPNRPGKNWLIDFNGHVNPYRFIIYQVVNCVFYIFWCSFLRVFMFTVINDWLIEKFYAKWFGSYVHFAFCVVVFCTRLYSCIQVFLVKIIVWFQVLLSDTKNYIVLSNYIYLIIIICLHRLIWFQVTNNNL